MKKRSKGKVQHKQLIVLFSVFVVLAAVLAFAMMSNAGFNPSGYLRTQGYSGGYGAGYGVTPTPTAGPSFSVDLKVNKSDGPITVPYNSRVILSWKTTNAKKLCTASGDWKGTKFVNGSSSIGKLKASATYTLTCTGKLGETASDSVTVNIGGTPSAANSTVDLKVNGSNGPITIKSGASAMLSWTSTNATSCTASNAWSGYKMVRSSEYTGSLTASKTYTLTCSGNVNRADDSVTVNVGVTTPKPY